MATLLVVDDEPNVCYSLQKSLRSDSLDVCTAGTAKEGIAMVEERHPDAVVLDVRLPDMSGLDAFDRMHRIDPRLPVIIITAHATTETAIEAMKRGAFDYLLKPVDLPHLRTAVGKAVELSRLNHVPAVFDQDEDSDPSADRIIGKSSPMQAVYKALGRVAPQDVNVLILGESGTGKELVARAVYHHSRRSRAPFLAINCAAIPEALLESELFGHERGAFTGADRRRIGKFEQANGGTVFLDEVGDMAPSTQSKVLRLLQDGRFERVGGNETVETDVRIIAATNQNLQELADAGRFRPDLFYRLNVFTIQLPPLRERMDDLPELVRSFVARLSRELDKPVRSVSAEVLQRLRQHDWPGNVRELESTIKYALVRATGEVITPDSLPEEFRGDDPAGDPPEDESAPADEIAQLVRGYIESGESDIYRQVHAVVDRVLLEEALRHVHGNQVQASELLGISRTTFRSKLRSLGLTIEKAVREETGGDA